MDGWIVYSADLKDQLGKSGILYSATALMFTVHGDLEIAETFEYL